MNAIVKPISLQHLVPLKFSLNRLNNFPMLQSISILHLNHVQVTGNLMEQF